MYVSNTCKSSLEFSNESAPRGLVVHTPFARNLLTFLMVFGPGLIVMEADNDAGAVSSYIQAGALYGTRLLWLMLVLLPITYFVQEMVVRLGIATGQGHAAMIYKRFGRWWGAFSLFDLELVNFLTLVTEFAAIALALPRLGVPASFGVPAFAIALILIVVSGSYLRWERIVVGLCLLDGVWFGIAWYLRPPLLQAVHDSLIPTLPPTGLTPDLMFLTVAIVGTTIAPWQLFFQQSCVADKRLRFGDLNWARLDTFLGACFTVVVAMCMMVAGGASSRLGFSFTDPARMAADLGRALGPGLKLGILLMMCNAAVL
ncbi:MAG TPA: Nramp family divalent metal transporter, partial [Candidatus Binataceae bacterium]|nr:Nramp family divalent metal transporter [Candidatus Binataceae bacterium]